MIDFIYYGQIKRVQIGMYGCGILIIRELIGVIESWLILHFQVISGIQIW